MTPKEKAKTESLPKKPTLPEVRVVDIEHQANDPAVWTQPNPTDQPLPPATY